LSVLAAGNSTLARFFTIQIQLHIKIGGIKNGQQ
jgi:hypothetical protein